MFFCFHFTSAEPASSDQPASTRSYFSAQKVQALPTGTGRSSALNLSPTGRETLGTKQKPPFVLHRLPEESTSTTLATTFAGTVQRFTKRRSSVSGMCSLTASSVRRSASEASPMTAFEKPSLSSLSLSAARVPQDFQLLYIMEATMGTGGTTRGFGESCFSASPPGLAASPTFLEERS